MCELPCDVEEDLVLDPGNSPFRNEFEHQKQYGCRTEGYSSALAKFKVDGNVEWLDSGISSFGDDFSSNARLDSVDKLFTGLSVRDRDQDSYPSHSDQVLSVSLSNQINPHSSSSAIQSSHAFGSDSATSASSLLSDNHRFDSGVCQTSSLDLSPVCSLQNDDYVVPEAYVFQLYEPDEDGDNQVHNSIIQRKPAVAVQVISLAASYDWLNQTNKLSQTPLHLAVITNQPDIVRRLMVAGAQVDVRDSKGNTPLHIACTKGFTEITRILLKPVNHTEIHVNKYEIPYQKIPQDLESRNYDGLSCMHLSALGNHLDNMSLLLQNRANINIADGKSGRTVLHYAAECGNEQLLKFILREPSTRIDEKTYAGLTAIALAKGRGYLDAVEVLFVHGADTAGLDEDSDDSDNEMDMMYDDIRIAGEPVSFTCS
ncbi:NF-kappa-B inhibitor alpha [Patella vulgata]|uniref:NF-kappa-B inhibitor alpha n=1 Tax=Patella vulgata TaxID=6465 RepID=UPI0021806BF0|nr:NF-kappa-B inhibitor alpha [Patella vulgata]